MVDRDDDSVDIEASRRIQYWVIVTIGTVFIALIYAALAAAIIFKKL